jgi:(R,R)-butanediol dehydrogenase/meso-butanediol dehydrogenase/diacetyl reductase
MFHGAGKPLTIERVPDPVPGPDEMVIKVGSCGICGSDISLTESDGWYAKDSILGHEFAGEVVAIGKGVDTFKVGDVLSAMPAAGCGGCPGCYTGNPVLCHKGAKSYQGAFADYALVNARTSIKLPSTLTLADGALVEPLAVGLHGVALAALKAHARVLVLGAGSIALGAIFFARRLGAGRIVALSRSRRRADLAMVMGADALVTAGENEQNEVIEALGGPPDVVLECIGAVGALGQAIGHVRTDGTVISLGFCVKPDPILPSVATYKQVRLTFSMTYTLDEFHFCADTLDRGHLEPRQMISSTIALEAVPAMIDAMRAGANETKVQVDPALSL